MHIAIIGGSGRVGSHALMLFLSEYACANSAPDLQLTLLSPNPGKGHAVLREVKQNLFSLNQHPFDRIKTMSTDQYTDLKGADLVVMLASEVPTEERTSELMSRGIEHRMTLSYVNKDLVERASQKIQINAPRAHVMVVTNQADLMAAVVRKHMPPERVLGFGGMVDSLRFHYWLNDYAKDAGMAEDEIKKIAKSHIVGYHNNDMIVLRSTLQISGINDNVLNLILNQTREDGYEMTVMRGGAAGASNESTSPWIVPGTAVASAMAAFAGLRKDKEQLEESFNVILDESMAQHYGVQPYTALSVPIRMEQGSYQIVRDTVVSKSEQSYLASISKRMTKSFEDLMGQKSSKPPVSGTPERPRAGKRGKESSTSNGGAQMSAPPPIAALGQR